MKISTPGRERFLAVVGLSIIAVVWGGCSSSEEQPGEPQSPRHERAAKAGGTATPTSAGQAALDLPAKPNAATKDEAAGQPPAKAVPREEVVTKELEEIAAKPRDLGPPLVDDPKVLRPNPLQPQEPVWVDPKNRHVVVMGEACVLTDEEGKKRRYPLEFFATFSPKSYEAVVAVNVKPSIIHTCLLLVGAKPGHPAQFQPKFEPPTGTEIAIEVRWKDEHGKVQSAPAGDWIRDIKTKKALKMNWVFAGSQFVTDETTKKEDYMADRGDMICVLSLPTALLDLPIYGSGDPDSRSFEAFTEHLPPAGTPVTLLLKPILPATPKPPEPGAARHGKPSPPPAEQVKAEKEAAEAAQKWLKLVDEEEYSRAWEAASEEFKTKIERREWVKLIGDARKPLGKVKSRQADSQSFEESNPDGEPVARFTALYAIAFENGKKAAEILTLTPDRNKTWRVSAYRIDEEKRTDGVDGLPGTGFGK